MIRYELQRKQGSHWVTELVDSDPVQFYHRVNIYMQNVTKYRVVICNTETRNCQEFLRFKGNKVEYNALFDKTMFERNE